MLLLLLLLLLPLLLQLLRLLSGIPGSAHAHAHLHVDVQTDVAFLRTRIISIRVAKLERNVVLMYIRGGYVLQRPTSRIRTKVYELD